MAITEEVGMSTPWPARRQRRAAAGSAGGSRQSNRLQCSRPPKRASTVGPMAVSADGAEEHGRNRGVEHGVVVAADIGAVGAEVHGAVGAVGQGAGDTGGRHGLWDKKRRLAFSPSPI